VRRSFCTGFTPPLCGSQDLRGSFSFGVPKTYTLLNSSALAQVIPALWNLCQKEVQDSAKQQSTPHLTAHKKRPCKTRRRRLAASGLRCGCAKVQKSGTGVAATAKAQGPIRRNPTRRYPEFPCLWPFVIAAQKRKSPRARYNYDEETAYDSYMSSKPGFHSGLVDSIDASKMAPCLFVTKSSSPRDTQNKWHPFC